MLRKIELAMNNLQACCRSQKAQGIVEYALILAFVVVVAAGITNAGGLKDKVTGVFSSVTNAFDTTSSSSSSSTGGGD